MDDSGSYWRSAGADEAMQDEHGFVWKAMLDTIEVDLAGKRVLDAGCNRGGFLRLLSDAGQIVEGCGYDPASGAITECAAAAHRSTPVALRSRRLRARRLGSFDVAFSHEVLYLIHDLAAHAGAIFEALVPGGAYYAVMGVHDGSPLMAEWHRANIEQLPLPRLYNIDEVAGVFGAAGFEVAGARLDIGFVPASGHSASDAAGSATPDLLRRIEYYNDDKLLLRCKRPSA